MAEARTQGNGDPAPAGTRRSRGRIGRLVAGALAVVLAVVVAFSGFLLLKPVSMPATVAAPDPTSSFVEAMARFDRVRQREAGRDLLPVCRSRILSSGARASRAIVLLHGYTNCPEMFEKLGERLAAEGFNVYIPLAPEHGETDREHSTLADLTTEELIAYGNEAVDIATGLGDQVTVLGLSGGGAVAAYLAQSRDDVDKAILVAPFLGLRQVAAPLTSALVNLADTLPPIAWGIPESLASGGQYAPYAGLDNNTRSAAAYMRLGRFTLDDAALHPHRAGRTVTVVNEGDDTVNNDLADELTQRWREHAPDTTAEHRFPASMGLPHDLVGPDRADQRIAEVYRVLLVLIGPP
jgi:pimeloyl-ACP methyl ester carboxylesterase